MQNCDNFGKKWLINIVYNLSYVTITVALLFATLV